jgi:hypothetical protein
MGYQLNGGVRRTPPLIFSTLRGKPPDVVKYE